eukprot:6182045-Pleurochrysis_carterae.AAC.3
MFHNSLLLRATQCSHSMLHLVTPSPVVAVASPSLSRIYTPGSAMGRAERSRSRFAPPSGILRSLKRALMSPRRPLSCTPYHNS